MPTELKMELRKMQNGGIRCLITSVDKPIRQMLLNRREYYEKARAYLKKAGDFDKIWIIVDSQGGSLDSAIGLTSALCMEKVPKRVLIDGCCHSAATLLLELDAPVYMTERSSIYIHSPNRQRYKRQPDGEYQLVNTESYGMKLAKAYMVESYKIRCKRTRKKHRKREYRQWVEEGKRFTAAEAVEAGMADGIMSRAEFDKG